MMSSRRLVSTALALTGMLAADAGEAWSARPPRARIAAPSHGAEVRRVAPGSLFRAVAAGDELPSRAEIRTADSPLHFTLADGTRVELAPRSRVSLLGPMDLVLDRGGKIAPERLELTAGDIRIEAPASVRSPAVVVASREVFAVPLPGATLRAHALAGARAGASTGLSIAVDAGEARFATKGAWKTIARDQGVEALADGPAPAPTALSPAPPWAYGSGACASWPEQAARMPTDCPIGVVIDDGETASIPLGWRAVPGATGYVLEIARDTAFSDVVARQGTKALTAATRLPAGRYFARVASHTATSLPGTSSAPREVRVVRLELPAGSAVRDAACALPRDRRIAIDDVAGLELAPGKSGFSRAPAQFGLIAEAPTTMRLRPAGAHGHAEITLRPSPLRAAITMTPTNAIWPTDPLALDIVIEDDAAPVSASFEPKLVVRVNTTEVPVEWWRRGNRWRAQLAPQTQPGPWVVRVEARDPHGNEIGRAHVEVISLAPVATAAR